MFSCKRIKYIFIKNMNNNKKKKIKRKNIFFLST